MLCLQNIVSHTSCTLDGSEDASYEENTFIFDEVFKYIDSTQRLSTFEDMFDTSTDN